MTLSIKVVEDLKSMKLIWDDIFANDLGLEPKNINVLVSDTPLSTREKKQDIAKELFECGVKSLAIMNSAVLSLFSTGRTTGIVVECG